MYLIFRFIILIIIIIRCLRTKKLNTRYVNIFQPLLVFFFPLDFYLSIIFLIQSFIFFFFLYKFVFYAMRLLYEKRSIYIFYTTVYFYFFRLASVLFRPVPLNNKTCQILVLRDSFSVEFPAPPPLCLPALTFVSTNSLFPT